MHRGHFNLHLLAAHVPGTPAGLLVVKSQVERRVGGGGTTIQKSYMGIVGNTQKQRLWKLACVLPYKTHTGWCTQQIITVYNTNASILPAPAKRNPRRSAVAGNTCSTMGAAVSTMRHVLHPDTLRAPCANMLPRSSDALLTPRPRKAVRQNAAL